MAIGAPPDLLGSAQRAMADQIEHAQRCFALASSYADAPIGPAPLDVGDIVSRTTLEAVARGVVDEACISETLAAIKARAALVHATDPAVRETLTLIADQQLRHAELGWRTLHWALEGCSALARARLRAYLTKAIVDTRRSLPRARGLGDARLAAHGKLAPGNRTRVLNNALETIIEPCASALLKAFDVAA